jgi:hypothetical protein
MLRRRRTRIEGDALDLSTPIEWSSDLERQAAIAFFNAAFRAEESGLTQAHELADRVRADDPELAECLELYGDEEGWHRELLTQFLAYMGGEIRPMGRVTGTFYRLYGRAKAMESIVLVNLMFETIGATTYRLALRRARHPAVRQMLTILTRDESFHVPLNVHFLRQALARSRPSEGAGVALKLKVLYHVLYLALIGSAYASRRKAKAFDTITFKELSSAYVEHLGSLFMREEDLDLRPFLPLLWLFGFDRHKLASSEDAKAISIEAAEQAADRQQVVVSSL